MKGTFHKLILIIIITGVSLTACSGGVDAPEAIDWGEGGKAVDFEFDDDAGIEIDPLDPALEFDDSDRFEGDYIDDNFGGETKCSEPEEAVRQVVAIGPFDAWTVKSLSLEAGEVSKSNGLEGSWNGQQDAFRHCYFSCRMTEEIGADQARTVGNLHEACGASSVPDNERNMDLYNNKVGRGVASAQNSCNEGCMAALNNGDLIVISDE